jgi:hypothetical protein
MRSIESCVRNEVYSRGPKRAASLVMTGRELPAALQTATLRTGLALAVFAALAAFVVRST